jgi:hypothetical protein
MKLAVEWLIDEHFGGIENCTPDFRFHIQQAKEMEKEQQFSDYMRGWDDGYQNKVKNPLNDNPKQQEQ